MVTPRTCSFCGSDTPSLSSSPGLSLTASLNLGVQRGERFESSRLRPAINVAARSTRRTDRFQLRRRSSSRLSTSPGRNVFDRFLSQRTLRVDAGSASFSYDASGSNIKRSAPPRPCLSYDRSTWRTNSFPATSGLINVLRSYDRSTRRTTSYQTTSVHSYDRSTWRTISYLTTYGSFHVYFSYDRSTRRTISYQTTSGTFTFNPANVSQLRSAQRPFPVQYNGRHVSVQPGERFSRFSASF